MKTIAGGCPNDPPRGAVGGEPEWARLPSRGCLTGWTGTQLFRQPSPNQVRRLAAGYTLIGFLLVLFGLTVVSILVATSLLGRVIDRNQRKEEARLHEIRSAFLEAVARTQTIPTYTNWLTALPPFASLDRAGLNQTHPEWGTDATLSRAVLIDANLPPSLLPYQQPAAGLTGSRTNLLGTAARVLIVSSTKRGLALPISSGVPSSNAFNAIWNWIYSPATKAPPAGWTGWTGFGEFLHVERINLANFFHQITFENLRYGVAGAGSVTNLVTGSTAFQFLYGTTLWLATTNGVMRRAHVVTRDASFAFVAGTNAGPVLHFNFTETGGAVATNAGSAGTSANGTYTNGITLGVAGPRPPAFTNFPPGNTGISLDGIDDYVRGRTNGPLNNATGLTVAGWINPATNVLKNMDLFGQDDVAEIGFSTADGKLEFWCESETKKLHYMSSFTAGVWHHLAGVADGASMYLYVDAVLVASRVNVTTNYGSSAAPFNIGGNVFGAGQYFPGLIDGVVGYNRALSAAEIAQLYAGLLP